MYQRTPGKKGNSPPPHTWTRSMWTCPGPRLKSELDPGLCWEHLTCLFHVVLERTMSRQAALTPCVSLTHYRVFASFWQRRKFIHPFVPFLSYVSATYYVPGTVWGTKDPAVNETQIPVVVEEDKETNEIRFWKILWRRKWQPTPVFLPGESHEQRSLVGYSPWGRESWTRLSNQTTTTIYNIKC